MPWNHGARLARKQRKEHLLETINHQALSIAREVVSATGALFAGDICPTNVFIGDAASRKAVRAMFEEQVGWAAGAGVDYVIGETFSYAEEALIALDVVKQADLPAGCRNRAPLDSAVMARLRPVILADGI